MKKEIIEKIDMLLARAKDHEITPYEPWSSVSIREFEKNSWSEDEVRYTAGSCKLPKEIAQALQSDIYETSGWHCGYALAENKKGRELYCDYNGIINLNHSQGRPNPKNIKDTKLIGVYDNSRERIRFHSDGWTSNYIELSLQAVKVCNTLEKPLFTGTIEECEKYMFNQYKNSDDPVNEYHHKNLVNKFSPDTIYVSRGW